MALDEEFGCEESVATWLDIDASGLMETVGVGDILIGALSVGVDDGKGNQRARK